MKSNIFGIYTIFVFLHNTVFTRSNRIQESTVLRPGVEYHYTYKSQALSGIPVVSGLQSGFALHCDVRLQILRDGPSILQMEEVRVFRIDDMSASRSDVMLNESRMILLSGEQNDVIREMLHKPIRFGYHEGEIRTLQTSRHDEYWSINIKKGLLSLLQLKLNQKSSHISPDTYEYKQLFESVYPHTSYNPWPIKQLDKTFSVIESDINGDCETQYSIGSNPRESMALSSSAEKVVFKVKNLKHCLNKNSYDIGLFSGMFHYSSEQPLIEPTIQAEYLVTGDRFHFLIKSAVQVAKYHFSPSGPDGGQFSTNVIQHLTLMATFDYESPIPGETSVLEAKNLRMEVPQASLIAQRSSTDQRENKEYLILVETLLEEIVNHDSEENPAILMQLSLVLRDVPINDLQKILRKYVSAQESSIDKAFDKKRNVLLETLMTVPTPDVALTLLDMIRDGRLTGVRASLVINSISLVTTPTSDVIASLLKLYRDPVILGRSEPHVHRALLLATGTLTNRIIHLMKKNPTPIKQVIATVDNVSKNLDRMLTQSQTDSDKVTVIKAMGNVGAKSLIDLLISTLRAESESITVRVQAVRALRKMAKVFNQQVQPDLLNIFMNKKENDKLRLACFKVLMISDPNFVIVQMIAQSVREESSQQVRSFVYTTLINIASIRSNVLEVRNTVQSTRRAIQQIRSVPVHMFDSKSMMWNQFFESSDSGVCFILDYLKSTRGILPDELLAMFHSSVFGNILNMFEIGIEGSGLETLFRRLLGPYGLLRDILSQKASILQLLKPLSRPFMDSAADRIRSLLNMKSVKRVEEKDMEALVHLKIFDQELQFWQLKAEQSDELFKKNVQYLSELMEELSAGKTLDILHTFTSVSNSHIVPTPLGIPLNLNLSAAAVFHLKGFVKARNFPTWTQWMLDGKGTLSKPLLIQYDVQSGLNWELFGEMALDMRWIKSGVAVKFTHHANLPINGDLSYDFNKNKISSTYSMPQKSIILMQSKIVPMTSVFYLSTTINKLPFRFELKELKPNVPTKALEPKIPIPLSDLGAVLLIEGYITKCNSRFCQMLPLTGRQQFNVILTALSHVNKKIYFELSFDSDSNIESRRSGSHIVAKVIESEMSLSHSKTSHHRIPYPRGRHIKDAAAVRVSLSGGIAGSSRVEFIQTDVTWLRSCDLLLHEIIGKLNVAHRGLIGPIQTDFNILVRSPWNLTRDGVFILAGSNNSVSAQIDFTLSGNYLKNSTFKVTFDQLDNNQWKEYMDDEGFTPETYDYNTQVQRYKASVRLHPVSQWVNTFTYGVASTVKHQWYPYLHIGNSTIRDKGNVTLLFELLPLWQKMNAIVMTPTGTSVIQGAPYQQNSVDESLHEEYVDNNQGQQYPDVKDLNTSWQSSCRINQGKVITYDGVHLLMAQHGSNKTRAPSSITGSSLCCEHLLAHDCTKRELFSVSASLCDINSVNLSVIIPQYHIWVAGALNDTQHLIVTINGDIVETLRSTGKFVLTEFPHDQHSRQVCTLTKDADSFEISLSELYMIITIRDSEILIKVSPLSMLHGQLCGLCGDFDYDASNDLRDLKGHDGFSSPQEFIIDMTIPSKRCDISEYKNSIYQIYNDNCMEEVTLKTERLNTKDQKEICFSVNPVNICHSGCFARNSKQELAQFVCLPAQNNQTKNMVEQIRRHNIVDIKNLVKSKQTISERVENVMECSSHLR